MAFRVLTRSARRSADHPSVLPLAFAFVLLLAVQGAALRLPEEKPGLRVQVNTLWNQDYLCFAAKVADPMVTGSSAAPMSAPQQDDAVEFDLELPGPKGAVAHRLIVSAAGGMTVLTRDARGLWRTDPTWISGPQTLKCYVNVDGTLNDPTDVDTGFTVECAIPWAFLGGEPPRGKEIGFNAVCWVQGEGEGLVSWSPMVRSESDASESGRWGKMLISPSSAPAVAQGAWLPSPYVGRTPFIDGKLSAQEWLIASALTFDKPEPVFQPQPAVPVKGEGFSTLLAVYRYDWQGDPSRPGARFRLPDGAPATSDQPQKAPGPWWSYERVAWHRDQLDEIQRAGIDIILARYRGDEEARSTWARTGLDRLSEALKGMRAEGRSYPLVGMMLDTAALSGADLTTDEGKRLAYGMIRDFFLHVPPEFWGELGADPDEGLAGGVPVLLGDPAPLANWDGGFLGFSQENFARDFGGARLVWLGSSQWRTRGMEGFYAYVRLPEAVGFTQEAAGGVPAVALSPGYCPPPGTLSDVRSRRDGRAYRTDWQRALAIAPELVVLNSWNDFSNGTELAPSRQYGISYVDLTRYFAARLASSAPRPLRLVKQAVPEALLPGADYEVELLVENVGTEDVRSDKRTTVDYRIERRSDGRVVQSKTAVGPLAVLPGQTLRLPVVISTRDDQGRPLPAGEYVFSLVVVRSRMAYLRSKWFARPIAELAVPFTVGERPARRAAIISTSLPSSLQAGDAANVVVRLRNDGSEVWRAGTTSLSYRWLRHDDALPISPEGPTSRVVSWGAKAELPNDVSPGQVVSVMTAVSATGADGGPLPVARPEDLWHYRVQWDLVQREAGWFAVEGAPAASEAIQVVARDRGVLFESADVPTTMAAGADAQAELVVANAGSRTWAASDSYLTYHWYRWDGRGPVGEAGRMALPSDVPPGERSRLEAAVRAPAVSGPYWLVWDVVANGEGFATAAGSRRADIAVRPVMVRGGAFRTLDLSALATVAAVTDDSHRSRGDFDAQARSWPAEWLPPDQSGAADGIYPSGYYAPRGAAGDVPFAFPDTSSGIGGALACDGQSIALGESGVRAVHLLLAGTAAERVVALGLKLAGGGTEAAAASVPVWTQSAPREGSTIGAYSPYLRGLTGDDASLSGRLYHVVVTPEGGAATALELPRDPSVRIVAITVEDRRAPTGD